MLMLWPSSSKTSKLRGRAYALPQDVLDMALDVMRQPRRHDVLRRNRAAHRAHHSRTGRILSARRVGRNR